MATWIAHLRIAENIMKKGYKLDPVSFAVGNIGPDSGVPNEDWSSFDPPKKITHWNDDNNKIDAQSFFDKYVNTMRSNQDLNTYSFILGYYVHLLTDLEWSKLYNNKKRETIYKEGLEKDKNFIWTIKKDWYGLDFLYLENHPESIFFTTFKDIDTVPDYLDYFPKGAFTKQVKYITNFYMGKNAQTKDDFVFLTEKEMDDFISSTTSIVELEIVKI